MKKEDREKIKSSYDTPKILKVGSAAERENFNLSNDHIKESPCITSVEPVGVGCEVLPSAVAYDGLPENITERIENAVNDYLLYVCKPPIEDLRKEKQVFFCSVCSYVGKKVNHAIVLPNKINSLGQYNAVSVGAVSALYDVFVDFCTHYNKITTMWAFSLFCGLSMDWFFDTEQLTPERLLLRKKIRKLEYNGIKEGLLDGSRNPTGGIATLNNEYWQNVAIPERSQNAVSSGSLPVLVENMETCENKNT